MSKQYRFDLRKHGEHLWEVFDTTNGRTVVIGGTPYCDLTQDSADVLADYMNSACLLPDEGSLH